MESIADNHNNYKDAYDSLVKSKEMSDVLNKVAELLLSGSTGSCNTFSGTMTEAMRSIADMADLDRLTLWRNHAEPDGLHTSQIYRWDRESGGTTEPTAQLIDIPYATFAPGWEEILVKGESINGPAKLMREKDLFSVYGAISVFITPILIDDYFWGFVLFSDHHNERYFDEHCSDMLRSAAFLCANAVIRHDMEDEQQEAQERNELQLTKIKLVIQAARIGFWDMDVIRNDPMNSENNILWSKEFRNIFGYDDENDFPDVMSSFQNCLNDEDNKRVTEMITAHVMDKTGKTPFDIEYPATKKNGEPVYIHATGETIRDDEGNPVRIAGIISDITEEKNTLIRTEKLREQAEEANLAKSAFLANMSHEIRTPLNAVIGLSDLILSSDDLDTENRYRLEQINNAGATLLGTVNDILDISKIESGKFELVPSRYDIPSMINDSVAQSIMQRGDKPVEFILNISEGLPANLYGDELRIKQILNNLLSNAFKYTLQGSVELSIRCERDGDDVWMIFKVIDTGIGIHAGDMKNLFTDYVQMSIESNRRVDGTGLGLSIANRLATLMGDPIVAESEYGVGSTFTVRIKQKYVTDEIIDPDVIESLKSLNYTDHKRQSIGLLSRISLPYARVLIVDDVITNLDVAKGLMKPYHMQIDCVTGGFEAIEAMHDERVRYNAIFMDHMMPGMDGIEATHKIREIGTDYAKNIPIIALTANAIVGNEEMFLSNGFQAFISKPIEIKRLDSVIRKWVRDKEQEKLYVRDEADESPASVENSAVSKLLFERSVKGLNIKKGIKRFGGDSVAYTEVLQSYTRNTPPLLEAVKDKSVFQERPADYITIIHGIKGSSYAIFAEKTGEFAESLENAAKDGDNKFVTANTLNFIESTKILINNINSLLEELNSLNLKQKKDKPDNKLLIKLREACLNYEMSIVDEAIAELEIYSYESDDGLVEWLRINAEQTNFDEIAEKLANVTLTN